MQLGLVITCSWSDYRCVMNTQCIYSQRNCHRNVFRCMNGVCFCLSESEFNFWWEGGEYLKWGMCLLCLVWVFLFTKCISDIHFILINVDVIMLCLIIQTDRELQFVLPYSNHSSTNELFLTKRDAHDFPSKAKLHVSHGLPCMAGSSHGEGVNKAPV